MFVYPLFVSVTFFKITELSQHFGDWPSSASADITGFKAAVSVCVCCDK